MKKCEDFQHRFFVRTGNSEGDRSRRDQSVPRGPDRGTRTLFTSGSPSQINFLSHGKVTAFSFARPELIHVCSRPVDMIVCVRSSTFDMKVYNHITI